jgi:tRNA(fMet)-specific endonuclease VapC
MNVYLLDTDTVSLLQHGHAAIEKAIDEHSASQIAITVMTVEEQLSGWYKELRRAKKPKALAAVYQRMAETVGFYAVLPILSFTELAIVRYQELQRLKLGIGKTDLRIAAIALEEQATVVSRNTRDFKRVPNLAVEDWSK